MSAGPSGLTNASLEHFVTTVRSLSGAGNFPELVEYLHKSGGDALTRNSSGSILSTVLETLDIQQHSLGVLAVLTARLQNTSISDWDDLFNRIAIFILECNGEQIRYSANNFAELCHLFTDQLIQRNTPIVGIPALLKAITKIQLNETSLTSVHSDVCKLCLASKCFSPAVNNLLNIDYVDIAKEATQDPKYILLFFYYGGMIFTALKKYERALYYYEACVTIPTLAVSHVMLEAYKKFLLVTLIVHGDKTKDLTSLPKYTSPVINKYLKPLCASYQELVVAYYSNQTAELENVISKYSDVFETDGNSGLVAQAAASQTKSNIKRLTKTFVTLSLEDVAAKVGLNTSKEAEDRIVAMIQEGSIHARISQKDGMVQFDANPEKFDSVKMLSILEDNVNACIHLNNQISQMEEEIILSPSYIKKSSSGVGGSTAPATPGGARSSELEDDIGLGGVGLGGASGLASASSSSHHRSTGASSSMGGGNMPSSSSTTSPNSIGATPNHVNSAGVSGSNASSSSNAVTQSSNMNGPA